MKYHLTNKRVFSLLLVFILIIAVVSGCGRDDTYNTNPRDNTRLGNITKTEELHYQATEIPIPPDFIPLEVKITENELFLSDYQTIIVIDYKGNELRRISFPEDMYGVAIDLLPDGSFWCIMSHYLESATSVFGYVLEKLNFVRFSREGHEFERIEAADSQFGNDGEYVHPKRMIVDGDYFYLMAFDAFYVVNKSGQKVMKLDPEGNTPPGGYGFYRSLFRLKDGRIAVASLVFNRRTDEYVYLIQIPDPKTKKVEEITFPANETGNYFATGKNADLLFCTDNGFFDVALEGGNQNLIFDNLRHGIATGSIDELGFLSDDSIVIALLSNEGRFINRLVRYNPVEEGAEISVIEKQAVFLAGTYIEEWLKSTVVDFNRSNERFFVEIWDYTENGTIDEEDAITRYNLDLMTGNTPDIIMLFNGMPSNHYVNKGIFADLNTFMDSDDNFDRADYLPGLFEAVDRNGKVFEIFPMFRFDVLMGKTADLGFDRGWTLEEFSETIGAKPDSQYIIELWTRRQFIGSMVQNYFVNPLTGECFFDRDLFKKILEVVERFPQNEVEYELSGEIYEGLSTGDPILMQGQIRVFYYIKAMEYLYFNDEVTLKGYPSPVGNGLYFTPLNYFGIADASRNPEGAWEFLKFAMDNSICVYGSLPVNLKSLETFIAKDKRMYEREGEFGTGFHFGGISKYALFSEMGELSDRNINQIKDAMMETSLIRRINPVISNIVMEEIDSFLSGQKTVDTVADIIENRIGIYLAEQE